jgi:GT2 family glycosyltransferase
MSSSFAKPPVCAVVLTHNHVDDTLACLASLEGQSYPNLQLLVVDNGSGDNTPARVRAEFPRVRIVTTGRNLGVPTGYNVGFSIALQAGAKYVLMLNNDTVLAPDMLEKLVDAADADARTGVAMPLVLYHDRPDVIWAAGGRRRRFPPAIVIIGEGEDSRNIAHLPARLEYAVGCCLLIHRRAFEKAGLLDPAYFFYFEDWDFSERVRASGLTIHLVHEARVWHKVSTTTRQQGANAFFYEVMGESTMLFYRRYGRPPVVSLLAHTGYIMAREVVLGNGHMLGHFLTGARRGFRKPLTRLPSLADAPSYSACARPFNS